MDIGSVGQSLQAAIAFAAEDRASANPAEDGAEFFESLLQTETVTDPASEDLWTLWPMAAPLRVAAPMALLTETRITPSSEPVSGLLSGHALAAAGLPTADVSAEGAEVDPISPNTGQGLPEDQPVMDFLASDGVTSSGIAVPPRDGHPTPDTVSVPKEASHWPDVVAPMPSESQPAAMTDIGTESDGRILPLEAKGRSAQAPATDPITVDSLTAITDMPAELGQKPRREALAVTSQPVTAGYLRMVVTGLFESDHAAEQPSHLREVTVGARLAEAEMPGADGVEILQPAALPPAAPVLEGESLKETTAADQQPIEGTQAQDDAPAAPQIAVARQMPGMMSIVGFPVVAPDGVPLPQEGGQGLANSDPIFALTLTEPGGTDVTIRAASMTLPQTEPGQEVTEIRLDPEELGRLRITLEGEGEALRVRVEVERPETLDLLRRHGDRLAETLREAGYDQADMQFSNWSGERPQTAARAVFEMATEPESEPLALSPLPSAPLARPAIMATGLNLRL